MVKQQKKIDLLEKCVQFYAKEDNLDNADELNDCTSIIDDDYEVIEKDLDIWTGGKLARETLKKIGEL